jgi:hypothetical protein
MENWTLNHRVSAASTILELSLIQKQGPFPLSLMFQGMAEFLHRVQCAQQGGTQSPYRCQASLLEEFFMKI